MMSSMSNIRVSFAARACHLAHQRDRPAMARLDARRCAPARARPPARGRRRNPAPCAARTRRASAASCRRRPSSSSTTAFAVDAPLISPIARSASTSCTNPNVRAPASSRSERCRAITWYAPVCRPISGCGKSIVTSSSSVGRRVRLVDRRRRRRRAPARADRDTPRSPAVLDDARAAAAPRGRAARCRPGSAARARPARSMRSSISSAATAASTCSTVCTRVGALAELRAPLGLHRVARRARGIGGAPGQVDAPEARCRCPARRGAKRQPARLAEVQADALERDAAARSSGVRSRWSLVASEQPLEPLHHAGELEQRRRARAATRGADAPDSPTTSRRRARRRTRPPARRFARPSPIVMCPPEPGLAREDHAVLDARRAGDADLRHDQAQRADPHVVPDVHEVVDLRAGADHGVVDAAAIDRRVRADLDVVAR